MSAINKSHQEIGEEQQLFKFNTLSPGSCIFLPHGTRIYNKLIDLIRQENKERDYTEVITPNLYNCELWKQSGHWQHYKDNMFSLKINENSQSTEDEDPDKDLFSLKPMNCPGHCLIFKSVNRSYKELPIRLVEFGILHRNEFSGSLRGLTRVRKFVQDDCHIFCRKDQISQEICNSLNFLRDIYTRLGFKYNISLSTRPDKYMGEIELWNAAENELMAALSEFEYTIKSGDGAFYGPKIDVMIKDATDREHQCGTIQLDFQLPLRFELEYINSQQKFETPVIIHRAILGSIERMFAILCEHYQGKWPFWLSPRQICIIPVSDKFADYASTVGALMKKQGYYVDIDETTSTLNKKIRTAETNQYNYLLIVGAKEKNNNTVNLRSRENQIIGEKTIQEAIDYFTLVN